MYYRATRIVTIVAILTLGLSIAAHAQRREMKKSVVRGDTLYTLGDPGMIPAIFDPEFIGISEADSLYHSEEPLMVVADGNEAKGYSIWHLDGHEIVNDYINGKAITVTW